MTKKRTGVSGDSANDIPFASSCRSLSEPERPRELHQQHDLLSSETLPLLTGLGALISTILRGEEPLSAEFELLPVDVRATIARGCAVTSRKFSLILLMQIVAYYLSLVAEQEGLRDRRVRFCAKRFALPSVCSSGFLSSVVSSSSPPQQQPPIPVM